jgi:retron-type reverse transcriptase
MKSKPSGGIDDIPIGNVTLASLISLSKDLKNKSYKPRPTKRIFIPKANGKMRPLGIASSRDKIVQHAMKVVLDPLFERIYLDSSHGFRSKRSCHTALNTMYHQ